MNHVVFARYFLKEEKKEEKMGGGGRKYNGYIVRSFH